MLEQTVAIAGKRISEKARQLSRDMFDEFIVNGRRKVEPVSYEQALTVLKYMRNQYVSAKDDDSFSLPDAFASEDQLGSLFEQAFRMVDYSKSEEEHAALYRKCEGVYARLRKVADRETMSVAEKVDAIDNLSARLHGDCAREGGKIGRLISTNPRFSHR